MKKNLLLRALTISTVVFSVDASALVLNGKTYKSVSSVTTKCHDGSKAVTYKGAKYCPTRIASLAWAAPTKRTNGKALAIGEISGYEVYWTRTKDKMSGVIKVPGGSAVKTKLEVFMPDTYNFAVSAIDTKGLKSPLSGVVSTKLL